MKKALFVIMAFISVIASAQNKPEVIQLWQDGAPESNGLDPAKMVVTDSRASATTEAVLTLYKPCLLYTSTSFAWRKAPHALGQPA